MDVIGRSFASANAAGFRSTPLSKWLPVAERAKLLSGREMEVFELLGVGFSNRMIASELYVTERTVKAHMAQILAKLGVESRLQAGLVAQACLILQGEEG
ncbi:response regulator transcription factor [Nocardia terpenica]|uniref:HTH luxR-type domain-containing protein n=1 Tax=Nocardia terpenica TaxID=455432 RepID=A0A291RQL9_9NOCA|nr:LuxR C-terminal-related transcriptional regulator [Nocardia terpenica]ATL69911.1 hypothetical protein CRH09_30790 [Nocardia terpenica]